MSQATLARRMARFLVRLDARERGELPTSAGVYREYWAWVHWARGYLRAQQEPGVPEKPSLPGG